MNAYTFIAIAAIIINSSAQPVDVKLTNVGTVLFSDKDLHRKVWPKTDVALLEARKQLQHLIPPPKLVNPSYNFVDILIDYLKQSYTSIKNTASNPEEDSILTTALSDIIGGYFKLWIIPTTNFAYYSGTITQEQAFRVLNFYDEIKKYLQTDGSGWNNPDSKILQTIVQKIPHTIPQEEPESHIRSTITDPCELFVYFEKTPEGFTIPLPYIYWEQNTMFVPFKDHSIVNLTSPKDSNILVNYYTAATSCLQSRSPNITYEFDEKFQSWLLQNVLPHLTDNRLYVALGNVLKLFNYVETEQSICSWEDSLVLSKPNFNTKKCYLKCQIKCYFQHISNNLIVMFACMWCHKIIIFGCILCFGILWCIFATWFLDCDCVKYTIFYFSSIISKYFFGYPKKDDLCAEKYTSTVSPTPEYIDDLKCNENCKPCHTACTKISDSSTDEPFSQETAEKCTQDPSSSFGNLSSNK